MPRFEPTSSGEAHGDVPATNFRTEELMAAVVARELNEDEVGFVGVGSSGRAFTLTFGIPVVAARLAQLGHAPGFALMFGSMIDPELDQIPSSLKPQGTVNLRYHHEWPAAARLPAIDNMETICAGRLDVSFVSTAQIDPFGNLNITCIGPHEHPHTRLVGCLAQPELLAFARRPVVIVDQSSRVFVPRVDFVTSAGHLRGGDSRAQAGLNPGGPRIVVTDLAVFDFQPESRCMRLRSLHPGVTPQLLQERTGFELDLPARLPETPRPSKREVERIRREIDPYGVLLGPL